MVGLMLAIPASAQQPSLKGRRIGGTVFVMVRDVAAYYGLGKDLAKSPERAEYASTNGRLTAQADDRDVTINGVRHWLSVAVVEHEGRLWISKTDVLKVVDPVLRHAVTAGKRTIDTVVLDAGHGGVDQGARGRSGVEKTLTLDLAKRVEKELAGRGVQVFQTRSRDRTLALEERVEFATQKKANLFVSIHLNSGGSAEGIETYCVPAAGTASTASGRSVESAVPGNKFDEKNVWLAHCVQKAALQGTGAADRGVRRARFLVIREAVCPAILVEGGFLSNRTEEQQLLDPEYREKLAKAIAAGILEYKKTTE